ncbi:bifunctional 2',3'-cyclic-nucleotide 2'-phosphodiesterase/3'-nucleotidase [Salimicrobium halophilum]|uniref:2',3'-cyclic-nucleotide 2'-phosphodiesterase / 3'-nucleotidase n=1 Tax=Salimicrobium halophilum TaxID=86666 RepID=A0A1G8SX96_9BACI|nr:bifunctional 2',3'-cyclic-nucleotide 2'-phosphodiesterase/3'-nucleotidase [Salimicrobium halophilum]SDJ33902.1 2',3'-cyclic-nucleotide 2'-phosphodiesterase / 3'-nucleotidase [Salimicrobium halophilum]
MKKIGWLSAGALVLGMVLPTAGLSAQENGDEVNLRLMETTDIHSNVMNFDYFSGTSDDTVGLVKVASLIEEAEGEAPNNVLIDNGDLIQGNPLADYVHNKKVLDEEGNIHPVYKAMNLLDYDAGNYGNHEFNYGLEYLSQATDGSDFPYVNANVYKADDDDDPTNNENYFDPYVILDKEVTDEDGDTHTIQVGVIGFTPPQIMQWDKDKLQGKVETRDLKETAEKFIPEMKEAGADVIVGVPHSGLGNTEDYIKGAENQTYQLTTVDGFDALLFGHSHQAFPSEDYAGLDGMAGVDLEKGTINGVAVAQAGFWGSHLGVVDLSLEYQNGEWTVADQQSEVRAIYDSENGESLVDNHEGVEDAVEEDHEATQDYVATPVGETEVPLYSYFSQVLDDPTVQIVNDAQKQYVEKYIQGTEYDGLPVLSAAAPFKAGRDGVSDFTDIEAGDLAIKDTTSLYKYPNTVRAVKINGAQVIEWLEWSAGQFNQIDPEEEGPQQLVKENTSTEPGFPSYNFDVIDGITYEIDVTEPARYNNDGEQINDSHRIENVQYQGEAIDPDQEFLVATNNYRANMKFANPDGDNVVIESPDENRQVLVNYIQGNESINPKADENWSFAPIEGDPTLTFTSAPGGQKYSEDIDSITYQETKDDGFATYEFNLPEEEQTGSMFEDVPEDHHFAPYIYPLTDLGVIKGYSKSEFRPDTEVTRAQFAAFISRALDLEAEGELPFTDVNDRFGDEVTAVHEAGITNGYTETTFRPDENITREQMATMLMRAYNLYHDVDYEAEEDHIFEDEGHIRKEFDPYINAAHELGIMEGQENNIFRPKDAANREEAAKVIYQIMQ